MEAAKTGTIVSVNGSVGGGKKGIVYINPSRALLWEIKDVSNLRVGSVRQCVMAAKFAGGHNHPADTVYQTA